MSLDKIIVALDVETKEEAISIVKKLGDRISYYKIGSVLFTSYGPSLIHELKSLNKKVFLDLKYHDIPNTVANAIKHAVKNKVDMITLHTCGGFNMLKEAVNVVENLDKSEHKPILLGVTVLTSMKTSDLKEVGVNRKVESQVKKLAIMSKAAGMNGFVCSAKEIKLIRRIAGPKAVIVVPGIRFADDDKGDQKRVATPSEAIKAGASYLVIGRSIIKAENVGKVLDRIEKELL